MEVSWQRRHPTAGFCFAFINMESKDWIFLRQNWKAYLGLKLLPSKCTMLVEKSWISKFSIAEIFFWQETADFYQISISISSGPVRSRCRPDIIVQAKGIAPFVAYNMADLHVHTIRPNFSGSHTFSLTATTARRNVIYKGKTKVAPNLRLMQLKLHAGWVYWSWRNFLSYFYTQAACFFYFYGRSKRSHKMLINHSLFAFKFQEELTRLDLI